MSLMAHSIIRGAAPFLVAIEGTADINWDGRWLARSRMTQLRQSRAELLRCLVISLMQLASILPAAIVLACPTNPSWNRVPYRGDWITGFQSRASFWASEICGAVIFAAIISRISTARVSLFAAAKLSHICAWT